MTQAGQNAVRKAAAIATKIGSMSRRMPFWLLRSKRLRTTKPTRTLAVLASVLLTVILCCSGCTGPGRCGGIGWTDKNGVQHVVIIGFGVVSFTNGPVTALDARAAGLVLDRGLSIGLVQKHLVEIDPSTATNAVVSIKSTPFGMQVRSFDFTLTNITDKPNQERKSSK